MTPSIDKTLHQFLTLLLISTLLPNLTFYLIVRCFHRIFATGATCQQRTLTPLDTWSCPTLGLARVLMLRPIAPWLVLFPDFWVSNIPRYFCFALELRWPLSTKTFFVSYSIKKMSLRISSEPVIDVFSLGLASREGKNKKKLQNGNVMHH